MGRYLQIDGLPGGVVGPLDELVQKCKELARRRVSRVRVVLICGEQAKLEGQLERALEDITDLAARVDDLRVERDELKTALEAHLAETVPELERARKRLDEIDRMNERRIPRVITTDELREGQVAVLMSGGSIDAGGSVMNVEHEGDCVFVDFSRPEETLQVMADHTIVLLADAPEPESEVTDETIPSSVPPRGEYRRGDVISRNDLRVNDVIDHWYKDKLISEGHAVLIPSSWLYNGSSEHEEIRLVHRPEPELPTEPGAVVLVTEVQGQKIDPPIKSMRDDEDLWMGVSAFPDGGHAATSEEITGFKNARIVVEDGA